MSEPIQLTAEQTELATLRRTNGELLTKSATRKTRITELEASVAALTGKLTDANASIRELTIGGPLKAMADSMSVNRELFMDYFSKTYQLELVNGELTLQTVDGKPVLKGDKPVPFERDALYKLLTNEAHPQAKVFSSILIASRASGASSLGNNRPAVKAASTPSAPQFGLR